MPSARILRCWLLLFAAALAWPDVTRAQVQLGPAPHAPTDVSGLPRGLGKLDVTTGFSVNTDSREEIRSFYNAVYSASTGVPIFSTSVVSNCFAGTNATAYQNAVLRRINWFRAVAGIPATVSLNSAYGSTDQDAALMMSANGQLNHFPPPAWSCYTTNGAHGASNSNIALGNAGPDAITAYIWDFGANNTEVGHRRWILYPQTQVMGTGDIPAQGTFNSANATFVFDGNFGGPRPATTKPYVAWPPEGYLPSALAFPQWSFAYSNANLSAATVNMKSNGVNVVIANQPRQTGFGEDTIVWVPASLNATLSSTLFPFDGTDTTYTITVTNIKIGAATTGVVYNVTLFDPGVPGGDYIPTAVTGPAQPGVNAANNYTCAAPHNPHVTGYQWRVSQSTNGNLFDGAETSLSNFVVNISPGYSARTNGITASGTFAFNLSMPAGEDQSLQLNRLLVPTTNTQIIFQSLLGYATSNQVARVQVSTTGGATWHDIYSQPGNGFAGEASFNTRTLSLSNYAGIPTLLRFNYHLALSSDGTYQTYNQVLTSPPVGWFINNLVVTNTSQLINSFTNTTASTNFTFTPTQPGAYILAARGLIFAEFPLDFGPLLAVTAVSNAVITLAKPALAAGQIKIDFTVSSGPTTTFKLLQVDVLGGAWITNASAVLTTNVPGSSYRFTAAVGPAARFYRVQTP